VFLDAFYIDRYEVTNAHFQQFVQATSYSTQAEREGWGYADMGEKWEKSMASIGARRTGQAATLRAWNSTRWYR
jgi:formylglycine-generating enzyme required for sulfatase activity